jgi:hypothetical protein
MRMWRVVFRRRGAITKDAAGVLFVVAFMIVVVAYASVINMHRARLLEKDKLRRQQADNSAMTSHSLPAARTIMIQVDLGTSALQAHAGSHVE